MNFMDAAANWADRRAVVVKFQRDEYDGWFAEVHLRDSMGDFSAIADAIAKKPRENNDDFQARVDEYMARAVARATERRIKSKARKSPMAA